MYRESASILHNNEDDIDTIIRVLHHGIPNESPDFYYKEDNTTYILEHFEFDATRKTRKGMKGLEREREIVRDFSKMPVKEDDITQSSTRIGKAISKEWYLQNIIQVFEDHYNKIPQYKKNLISQGKAREDSDFKVGFFIENEYPPLYDYYKELNLLEIKQFLDVFEAKNEVGFIVFGGYFGGQKQLFYMTRDTLPIFRKNEIDMEHICFSSLNANEVQWDGKYEGENE